MTKEQDVRLICTCVLENWENNNSESRYQCRYCPGYFNSNHSTKMIDGYPHSLDCPVLVATDLLTLQGKS